MLVQLIEVPYDSGHAGARMGQGPGHLLAAGAADLLRSAGHQVETIRVLSNEAFPAEIGAAFELAAALARQVRMAIAQRRFPIVLAGNCIASVGVLAGQERRRTGLIWCDAHADFNTPESSRSGFLDGMALATAAGHCWSASAARLGEFRPVAAEDILLVGARDIDPEEAVRLEEHGIRTMGVDAWRADPSLLDEAVARLGDRAERVHLHLDMDVLDPNAVAPANRFASDGGFTLDELLGLLAGARARCRIGSATLAAFDPTFDRGGRMRDAALGLLGAIASR